MNHPNYLAKIITRVPVKVKTAPHQSLIAIDPRDNSIKELPRLLPVNKNYKLYVVTHNQSPMDFVEATSDEIVISDFYSKKKFSILVNFRLTHTGNHQQLALALGATNHPEQAFQAMLEKAASNYSQENGSAGILHHFDQESKNLETFIKDYIFQQTGLQTQLYIELQYQDQVTDCVIKEPFIDVFTKDHPYAQPIEITAHLEPNREQLSKAVIHYAQGQSLDKLKEVIIAEIRDYFLTHIRYHDIYCGNLENTDDLKMRLNERLQDSGHKLTRLIVNAVDDALSIPEFIDLSPSINHIPHEAHTEITIKNDVQLTLMDAGRYKQFVAKNNVQLEDWVEQNLEQIIKQEVFELRYLDFLLRFNDVESRIRERMRETIRAIGFDIKHLITRPQLDEAEYQKPKTYAFKFTDLPTKEANISVSLEAGVTFFIEDLAKVEHLLNQSRNLNSVFEQSLRATIEPIVHGQEPELVYMHFNTPMEDQASLEQQISQAAKQHLEQEYFAMVIQAPVIKPSNTEIGDFVESLIDQSRLFCENIAPLTGTQTIQFEGQLTIVGVAPNGWQRIKKQNFGFNDVMDFFRNCLKANLESAQQQELSYTSFNDKNRLEKSVNYISQQATSEHFGLHIRVDNFRRFKSKLEEEFSNLKKDHELEEINQFKETITAQKQTREYNKEIRTKYLEGKKQKLDDLLKEEKKRIAFDDDESMDVSERISRHIEQNYEISSPGDLDSSHLTHGIKKLQQKLQKSQTEQRDNQNQLLEFNDSQDETGGL